MGLTLTLGLIPGACDQQDASVSQRELVVFVAASLSDAVEQIGRDYERERGVMVRVNAAASGLLRAQIERGARCDVFLSADDDEMNRLERNGRIVPTSRRVVVGNRLVIAAQADHEMTSCLPSDLSRFKKVRIAIGDPAYVAAGRYAKRFLESSGAWAEISNQTVFADNVRIALGYLRSGQVELAIIYQTDVWDDPAVKTLFRFDNAEQIVTCPAAICTGAANREAAGRFLEYLNSESASKIWRQMGFESAVSPAKAGR